MEITYNNGTVVTIRAPAKYMVTSRRSGWLVCGTAMVQVVGGSAAGQETADKDPEQEKYQDYWVLPPADPRAPGMARMPSFLITTPATTFLAGEGDEFSVSVDESWGSVTKVFRGTVAMLMPTDGRPEIAAVSGKVATPW